MKKILLVLVVMVCYGIQVNAQFLKKLNDALDTKITVNVVPDDAKISIGGSEVATGSYTVSMGNQDHVMVKFSSPGYIEKTVKVSRTDKTTMSYTLEVDDAWVASDVSVDIANKTLRIPVKNGMESDETWRRINIYLLDAFPDIERADRTVGWVRSAWNLQKFKYATIRTRIELKEMPGQNEKTISLTLFSQIASINCGNRDDCFKDWDRTLKTYIKFVEDFTNVLKTL